MTPSCVHHWVLAELPENDRFPGRCSYCGSERTWPVENEYHQEAMAGYRRRAKARQIQSRGLMKAELEAAQEVA